MAERGGDTLPQISLFTTSGDKSRLIHPDRLGGRRGGVNCAQKFPMESKEGNLRIYFEKQSSSDEAVVKWGGQASRKKKKSRKLAEGELSLGKQRD